MQIDRLTYVDRWIDQEASRGSTEQSRNNLSAERRVQISKRRNPPKKLFSKRFSAGVRHTKEISLPNTATTRIASQQ